MPKILLIAQGAHIARYAARLRGSLPDSEDLAIVVAHMEDAVEIAKKHAGTDTEALIARGTTADLLREAGISLPVVEIPIGDAEISDSLKRARRLAGSDATIGFIGFKNVIVPVRSFLETLNVRIRLYEIHSSSQFHEQFALAKSEGVSVIVGGVRAVELAGTAGFRTVLMDSSLSSLAQAYAQARSIIDAVAVEKKKRQETQTILNSVSDAIVSIDGEGRLLELNRLARQIFGVGAKGAAEKAGDIFTPDECAWINQAIQTGEEVVGAILERQGRKYALRAVPVTVEGKPQGAVVSLQEINVLQNMEAAVRKGLYQRGNVARYVFADIKGTSAEFRAAVEMAERFSRLQSNVLIIGDTGTGKEMFAQSIHNASPRSKNSFVAVNCGAIPENLLESELFGYDDGAFSGAKRGGRPGLFELAHGGTLFLDEVSQMGQAGQVSLLRALQEQQIRRVGGHDVIPVDVRVVAASNVNLYDLVRDNSFRKDLYYRLGVLIVRIPPLNRRIGDISVLAKDFLAHYRALFVKKMAFTDSALAELESFAWDGNIRQLKNFCERVVALADKESVDGDFIRRELYNSYWSEKMPSLPAGGVSDAGDPLVIKGRVVTRSRLEELLSRHRGNKEAISRELNVSRTTLWKLLKKNQIA
jgi:PAS domain S-box-containing protein